MAFRVIAMDLGLTDNFNPRNIDPALLTYKEWLDIVDPNRKCHPSSAYDTTLDKLNSYLDKSQFPKLIRTFKRHGLTFEIRLRLEKNRYVKFTPDGDVLRVDGEVQYFTDDEAKKAGKSLHEWSLGLFHDGKIVGSVQDEWGCILVMVAQEYRKLGLGLILHKLARSIAPTKSSGGFTPSGQYGFARVHAEFVRDALQSGLYTSLIKAGKITLDRVKEIIRTSPMYDLKRKQPEDYNLSSDDPKDWMMYVGEYGDFIIYDRKLRELLKEGDRLSHFVENMIKGIAYVFIMQHRPVAFLQVFGAETPKLRQFLMSCAIEYSIREEIDLYVEPDQASSVSAEMGKVEPGDKTIGFESQRVTPTGKRIEYDDIGEAERRWRKTFDQHDEFRVQMMELAFSKYR